MCDLVENYAKKKAADAVAKVTEEAVKELSEVFCFNASKRFNW